MATCCHLVFLLNKQRFFSVMCTNLLEILTFFPEYPWSFPFLSKIPPACAYPIHFAIVCSIVGCYFMPGSSNSQHRNVYLDSSVYRKSNMMQLQTHHSSLPGNCGLLWIPEMSIDVLLLTHFKLKCLHWRYFTRPHWVSTFQ